jgi:5-methylcytosine-specific restriction endonuclease McrA
MGLFLKMARNKKLAEKYRGQPCIICSQPGEGDHILPLGMGGSKKRDSDFNLWALCRQHHREKHDTSLQKFIEKYRLWEKIESKGFYWTGERYWHEDA